LPRLTHKHHHYWLKRKRDLVTFSSILSSLHNGNMLHVIRPRFAQAEGAVFFAGRSLDGSLCEQAKNKALENFLNPFFPAPEIVM
jgi:hypothetical protein